MSDPSGEDRYRELLEWRAEFPILETTTYLISNSLGAMPRAVESSLSSYTDSWRRRGVRAWHEGWWEMPVEVGDLVAPLLGTTPGSVSMHANVTIAMALFLSCIDYGGERNKIVYSEMNFPSVRYVLEGERKKGAEIRVVPTHDAVGIELEELLTEIDEQTRLVPISHVLFKSAYVQDVQAIAERCQEVGALLLLDVYQSAGVLPMALDDWGVDAAVGGCLKWLCGGPGNCFLWVRPELSSSLEPSLTGWQSHKDPFGFEPEHDRVDEGAWRFLTGTPNIPGLHAAIPGLEILGQIDMSALRARSLYLTDHLHEIARCKGFEIRTPLEPRHRGGTVTVWHPNSERLCQELLERDILCDYRPGAGIRFSPHFYSTVDECSHAIETLAELRD